MRIKLPKIKIVDVSKVYKNNVDEVDSRKIYLMAKPIKPWSKERKVIVFYPVLVTAHYRFRTIPRGMKINKLIGLNRDLLKDDPLGECENIAYSKYLFEVKNLMSKDYFISDLKLRPGDKIDILEVSSGVNRRVETIIYN